MYHMLILDDDPYALDRLYTCIDWSHLNIKIIGKATNGLEGLALALEHRPDIVICDIRMPLMDGISFASEFQRHYPQSQIIFLSGYADKNYMQNAIRLNVVDYIFKPYELSDLLSAIEKALANLDAQPSQSPALQSDELLWELLYAADSPDKLSAFLNNTPLMIDFQLPYICAIIHFHTGISFSQYTENQSFDSVEIYHLFNLLYRKFNNEIDCIFNGKYAMSKMGDNYIFFANITEQNDLSDKLLNKIAQLLKLESNVDITIGISPIYDSCVSIKTAFYEARQTVSSSFLLGINRVLSSHSARVFKSTHASRNQFVENLTKRNISNALNALNDYFTYMSNCAPKYIRQIQEDLLDIAALIKYELNLFPGHQINEFINQSNSLEDIRLYFEYCFNQYISKSTTIDNQSRIIIATEYYIMQHLNDSLSLQEIADHVFVSHTYLCHLYKKHT